MSDTELATDWCYVCNRTTAWTPAETCTGCGRRWCHDEGTPAWRLIAPIAHIKVYVLVNWPARIQGDCPVEWRLKRHEPAEFGPSVGWRAPYKTDWYTLTFPYGTDLADGDEEDFQRIIESHYIDGDKFPYDGWRCDCPQH
jgi:hypothetical protein